MTRDDVWERLRTVPDPEIPDVNIVDLGMIAGILISEGDVHITLRPTFLGCPALDWIRASIEKALDPITTWVQFDMTSNWTAELITPHGRRQLQAFGIAPPVRDSRDVVCPLCGSHATHRTSPFGPTVCRAVYYCQGCEQPFEAWKTV